MLWMILIFYCHYKKQKSTTNKVYSPGLNTYQTTTTDDASYYQELSDIRDDHAYQTLKQQ